MFRESKSVDSANHLPRICSIPTAVLRQECGVAYRVRLINLTLVRILPERPVESLFAILDHRNGDRFGRIASQPAKRLLDAKVLAAFASPFSGRQDENRRDYKEDLFLRTIFDSDVAYQFTDLTYSIAATRHVFPVQNFKGFVIMSCRNPNYPA